MAFLDISPVSEGHTQVIPKCMYPVGPALAVRSNTILRTAGHARTLGDLPDEYLADIGPAVKQVARATGAEQYNVLQVSTLIYVGIRSELTIAANLQNNGKLAHQDVDHVHFHVIPKPSPSDDEGLVIGWPTKNPGKDELAALLEEIKGKL